MNAESGFEFAIAVFIGLIFVGVIINFTYNLKIGGFFTELEEKDREAWQKLGSPSKGDNFKPVTPERKGVFLFVPVLRQKAQLPDYPRSRKAWFWFKLAAVFTTSMFVLAGIGVIYAIMNDLS